MEIKLSNLLGESGKCEEGLKLCAKLAMEVRKNEDKHLLVEVQLSECILHYRVRNMAKSKASLTAARACCNAIYVNMSVQAEIDRMSGVLLMEDSDYKTAYSYLFESFEAWEGLLHTQTELVSPKQ